MGSAPIRFDDGARYEKGMAGWSQLAGNEFLDWLAPAPGQAWVDIGCGNGAFTELVARRCAPSILEGIDPSAGQIDYARKRAGTAPAVFQIGDAMALPYADNQFDTATMALVLFFVPDPGRGLREMLRVLRPGGYAAAYVWDFERDGFPAAAIFAQMRANGIEPNIPPSVHIARFEALGALWREHGLKDCRQREILVTRRFADFDAFWDTTISIGSIADTLGERSEEWHHEFREGVRARVPADASGAVTVSALANAVVGMKP